MGALNCIGIAKDQALIEAARAEDLHELANLMVDRGTAVVDEVRLLPNRGRHHSACCKWFFPVSSWA
jgi:hypothetical protein